MSLHFLKKISGSLPYSTVDLDEIHHIAVLAAAKLIEYEFPAGQDDVVVTGLTPDGVTALGIFDDVERRKQHRKP